MVLCACSPTRDIAIRTDRIADRAREDHAAWTKVGQDYPELRSAAESGVRRADANIKETQGIHKSLTGVEDSTPWWASVIMWAAAAIVVVAAFLIMWQSGIFQAIRIAVGWLPKKKVSQAELAVSMLDPNSQENSRELVAAMRAQDPVFDAAFRKVQQDKDKKP